MSFMPNVGTIVKMLDGRIAIVSDFSPLGDKDAVMFADGHEEYTDAWKIAEMLTDEDKAPDNELLITLLNYLESCE